MSRRNVILLAVAAIALGGAGVAIALRGDGGDAALVEDTTETGDAPPEAALPDWIVDEIENLPPDDPRRVQADGADPMRRADRWGGADPEGRERMRRWMEANDGGIPPEIRERLVRRIDVAPLGPAPGTLTADRVFDVLHEARPRMRACADEAGGFRAVREEMIARGVRERPRVRFDVGADGAVRPGTVEIEPALPDAVSACIDGVIASLAFGAVGGDGARVEAPLGGRGPGGRRDGGGLPPR